MTVAGRLEGADPTDLEGYFVDRLATDIRMANEAGMASALVLTGASGPEEALASTDRPDYVIEHLGELLPASETHRPKAWNREGRGY
ncbi:MAG TPA: HAD hydrolase-like protein [Rubrobacteraceae bacterium]|nr:HAD hydrolase-like protein [Rubrobacteraceae bacterium]